MTRTIRSVSAVLAFVAAAGVARAQSEPAGAQPPDDRARAKTLAERGQDRFDAGDYAAALDLFQQAESAFHAPTIMLLIARTRARLGQRILAARVYTQIQREEIARDAPDAWRAAHELAVTELADLLRELGSVDVVVPNPAPGMVLTLGGQRLPSGITGLHPVEPNATIDVALTAPGHSSARTSVRVPPGQLEQVVLKLERIEPTPGGAGGSSVLDSPLPTAVSLAVAGLGLAVGIGAGIIALDRGSELDGRCVDHRCLQRDEGLRDDANTFGDVSTAGFVIGGVGLAAAGVFFFLSKGFSPSSASARLAPAASGADLRWQF